MYCRWYFSPCGAPRSCIVRDLGARGSLADACNERLRPRHLRLYEKGIKLKRSGNDVYYTNSLILLVKNMLCSKLHRQNGFNSIPCSYKSVPLQTCEHGPLTAPTRTLGCPHQPRGAARELCIDNLLVRIRFIIAMIRWTGLAPREVEFPFLGSLTRGPHLDDKIRDDEVVQLRPALLEA